MTLKKFIYGHYNENGDGRGLSAHWSLLPAIELKRFWSSPNPSTETGSGHKQ